MPTTRWSPPNSCMLALIDTGYSLDTARLARDRRWHTTIQQRQLRQTHSEFALSFSHFESRVLSVFSPSLLLRVISDPRSCSLTVSLSASLSLSLSAFARHLCFALSLMVALSLSLSVDFSSVTLHRAVSAFTSFQVCNGRLQRRRLRRFTAANKMMSG